MNTIDDAKKIRWIFKVLQAKLPEDSRVKIKVEITCFDQEMSNEGNLLRCFDVKNIPLLWAEISCLEASSLLTIHLVVTEKNVICKVQESHEPTSQNPGNKDFKGTWVSMDEFRDKFFSELYDGILSSVSKDNIGIYGKLIHLLIEK